MLHTATINKWQIGKTTIMLECNVPQRHLSKAAQDVKLSWQLLLLYLYFSNDAKGSTWFAQASERLVPIRTPVDVGVPWGGCNKTSIRWIEWIVWHSQYLTDSIFIGELFLKAGFLSPGTWKFDFSFASHATSPLDVKRRATHQILLWSSAQWERC